MGMTGKKSATKSTWTDPDDAPELTEEWFATADLYEGNKLIRRGRPAKAAPKEAVNIRLDPDVLAYFRATRLAIPDQRDAAQGGRPMTR
jgi:uncharacterized protein (DUF4415 family)